MWAYGCTGSLRWDMARVVLVVLPTAVRRSLSDQGVKLSSWQVPRYLRLGIRASTGARSSHGPDTDPACLSIR